MKTQINGKDADWSLMVRAKWDEAAASIPPRDGEVVTQCNYFTPRPFKDEYNRGSREEGFTYTINHQHVWQVIVKRHENIGGDPKVEWWQCGAYCHRDPTLRCRRELGHAPATVHRVYDCGDPTHPQFTWED